MFSTTTVDIHQHADGECHAAQRHDVHGLAGTASASTAP
jgi:hypothetical protein